MIQLMCLPLYPEQMEVLYDRPFSPEMLKEDFEIKDGKWYVDEDGWLIGENRRNSAAMCISKAEYFGDVLIEFDAATVLPATRDINVSWHMSWNEEKNSRGTAYVMGLQGWYDGYVGFEKSPEYKFVVNTKLLDFVPGKVYHVTVGNIKNRLFVAVDGVTALEIRAPDPIDLMAHGRMGFEAYCTRVRYKNLVIRRAAGETNYKPYEPEF